MFSQQSEVRHWNNALSFKNIHRKLDWFSHAQLVEKRPCPRCPTFFKSKRSIYFETIRQLFEQVIFLDTFPNDRLKKIRNFQPCVLSSVSVHSQNFSSSLCFQTTSPSAYYIIAASSILLNQTVSNAGRHQVQSFSHYIQ